MKKKKWLIPIMTSAIACIIIGIITLIILYFSPKTFLYEVEPRDVKSISVFNGSTGKSFTIENEDDIKYIVENIQGIEMKRGNISSNYNGFSYVMTFNGTDGKIIDSFIINSEDTIRDDPFFYRCNGGLCFDYLKSLEK